MARICPNCKSQDVEPDSSASTTQMGTAEWTCAECGYEGPMPEE